MKELNYRLWCCCFFRREKQKVLTQLPDKMRQYITCEITNRKEYKDAEDNFLRYLRQYKHADDDKIARAMRGEVMVRMGILKEIAARGKVKAVAEFIHDVIDGGEKLIMFAYLKEVVQALKNEFPDAVTVTGSDNITQKQNAVDRFQNDPECKLIILNYKSGGTSLLLRHRAEWGLLSSPGLTLTASKPKTEHTATVRRMPSTVTIFSETRPSMSICIRSFRPRKT